MPIRLVIWRVVGNSYLGITSGLPVIQTRPQRIALGSTRMLSRARSGSLGSAAGRFAPFAPIAKIEGDRYASSAQLIRKSAVDHGPSHDHSSDGQRSYALRCGATTSAILG